MGKQSRIRTNKVPSERRATILLNNVFSYLDSFELGTVLTKQQSLPIMNKRSIIFAAEKRIKLTPSISD